jgi:hypothetical protein
MQPRTFADTRTDAGSPPRPLNRHWSPTNSAATGAMKRTMCIPAWRRGVPVLRFAAATMRAVPSERRTLGRKRLLTR